VYVVSALLHVDRAAMKIALARHRRPMRTQRSKRRGSKIAFSAGSDGRAVRRTNHGKSCKLPGSPGAKTVAICYTVCWTIPAERGYRLANSRCSGSPLRLTGGENG